MNRFTTMALAAGTLALATASVAQAEMVQFNYTWYGPAPGNSDVTEWGMSHITHVTVASNGDFIGPVVPTLNMLLNIGGELSWVPVVAEDVTQFIHLNPPDSGGIFVKKMDLADVPSHGAMHFDVMGSGSYHPSSTGYWEGTAEIIWVAPNTGEPVTQSGVWTAHFVPAPGVIALFGLAGVSGRRLRD